jgi:hypothetical protein
MDQHLHGTGDLVQGNGGPFRVELVEGGSQLAPKAHEKVTALFSPVSPLLLRCGSLYVIQVAVPGFYPLTPIVLLGPVPIPLRGMNFRRFVVGFSVGSIIGTVTRQQIPVDLARPVWWVGSAFDLATFRIRMLERHPNWSDRQAGCVLYWQPSVRKRNHILIGQFLADHPGAVAFSPEGMGVNVTTSLRAAGVDIRWRRPLSKVHKGAMIGYPRRGHEDHPALYRP